MVRTTYTDGIMSRDGGGIKFYLSLLDDDYDAVRSDGTKWEASSPYFGYLQDVGDVGSETFKNLKPNSTYYIRMETPRGYQSRDRLSYAVCVKKSVTKPGIPAIKMVKAGKKGSRKLLVKYNKKNLATRYQIQLKKAGGSWKAYNNGTKLQKTFKKLKKGKKFYVRVRAQRKVDGKWYSSKWSRAKSVIIK